LGIDYHASCCPDAGDTYEYAPHKEHRANDGDELDLVFEILNYHIALLFDCYFIKDVMAPVADIFACWATPSPKFRVEKAVSPSGIIHAAKSGTKFKHFKATILAAIK
jgi:hypothetical protein